MLNKLESYQNLQTYELPNAEERGNETQKTIVYLSGYRTHSPEGINIRSNIAKQGKHKLLVAVLPGSEIISHGIDNRYPPASFSLRQSAKDLFDVIFLSTDQQIHLTGNSLGGLIINYMLAYCLQSGNHDVIKKIKSIQYISSALDIRHVCMPLGQIHSLISLPLAALLQLHPHIASYPFARELLSYNFNPINKVTGSKDKYDSLYQFYKKIQEIHQDLRLGYMGGEGDTVIDMKTIDYFIVLLKCIFGDNFQSHIFPDVGHGLNEQYAPLKDKVHFHKSIIEGKPFLIKEKDML